MKIYRCKRHGVTFTEYDLRPIGPAQLASYKSDAAKMRRMIEAAPDSILSELADDWERLDPGQAIDHGYHQCNLADLEVVRDD
jgi:hypothetical protein